MIRGVGIDIVEIKRIKKMLHKWGKALEKHILTQEEIKVGEKRQEKAIFLAGRIAAKEAIFKSLGVSPRWQEVQILPDEDGVPLVTFSSKFYRELQSKGVNKVVVSISHSKSFAIAQALALK